MKLNDIIQLAQDGIVLTRPSEIVARPITAVEDEEPKRPIRKGPPTELSAEL